MVFLSPWSCPPANSEAYLANALGDLQDQLFTDWETIVVNDCSPDGGFAIAQQFAAFDQRICIVSHEVNRGLSAARNTGLEVAQGRYVWFPDRDDRYDFTLLQTHTIRCRNMMLQWLWWGMWKSIMTLLIR